MSVRLGWLFIGLAVEDGAIGVGADPRQRGRGLELDQLAGQRPEDAFRLCHGGHCCRFGHALGETVGYSAPGLPNRTRVRGQRASGMEYRYSLKRKNC
jgi:hypothetical protein